MQLCIQGQTIPPNQNAEKSTAYEQVVFKILFFMRVSIIMMGLFTMVASLYAKTGRAQKLEEVRVSLQLSHVTLTEAMQRVEALTPFKFLAKAEDIENEKDISLSVKDMPANKVLR